MILIMDSFVMRLVYRFVSLERRNMKESYYKSGSSYKHKKEALIGHQRIFGFSAFREEGLQVFLEGWISLETCKES